MLIALNGFNSIEIRSTLFGRMRRHAKRERERKKRSSSAAAAAEGSMPQTTRSRHFDRRDISVRLKINKDHILTLYYDSLVINAFLAKQLSKQILSGLY